jgi:hypothetical protein
MKMKQYLGETKYSTENLLKVIWNEHISLERLNTEINKLEQSIVYDARQVQNILLNDDDDEDGLATFIHWNSYFGDQKVLSHKEEEQKELLQLVQIREFSISLLSSAVLQTAKQGLSLVHGQPNNWPQGKQLGQQDLSNVMRWGRNQGMHFGEGNIKQGMVDCFEKLTQDFGDKFKDYTERNLSFDIINLFGWRTYQDFENDMMLFEVN